MAPHDTAKKSKTMMVMNGGQPDTPYHVRLTPQGSGFNLKLGEVWRYRDLVLLLTKRTFATTYQQTILGPLWIVAQPVLSSLVYMFIFGYIAAIGTNGIPQTLFYFVSSAVWELFAFSLLSNASTFVTNASLFGKVYFPRLTVPISNMLVSVLKFLIQLAIIAVLMAVFLANGTVHPKWEFYPLLPLLFLQMSFMGMSVGILLSSLTTRYRDLSLVVDIGVNLLMYASAVVYPLSAIPEGILRTLVQINPMAQQMELIRMIMLGEGDFQMAFFLVGLAVTAALFVCSVFMFNRVERTFADIV